MKTFTRIKPCWCKKIKAAGLVFVMTAWSVVAHAQTLAPGYGPLLNGPSYFIQATQSHVLFANVEWVALSFETKGRVSIVLKEPEAPGLIQGPGDRVYLSAQALKQVFKNSVNQGGVVEAISIVKRNGTIELVSSPFENQRNLSWYLDSEGT